MEPKLGQTNMNVYQQANGNLISLAHQDNGADHFGWWSMVALLSQWEHTGMERLQMNGTLGMKHVEI